MPEEAMVLAAHSWKRTKQPWAQLENLPNVDDESHRSGVNDPRQQSSGVPRSSPSDLSEAMPAKDNADPAKNEQQAIALIHQGKLDEAALIYRELIKTGTKNHIVYGNFAAICGIQRKSHDTIDLLKTALILKPDFPDAHNNLGNTLKEQGDLNAAIAAYQKALQFKPDYAEAHCNLGTAFKEAGDLSSAIEAYQKALSLEPNYPEAHNNLGNALKEQGDLISAIQSYQTALSLRANYSDAHFNLGTALKLQGNLTAAITSFKAAIELKPNDPNIHNNLGNAFKEQGHLAEAIASYNTAIRLQPEHPDAQNNLSMAELLTGDYQRGWKRYNGRFRSRQGKTILSAKPACKQWEGEALTGEGELLLVSEQGLGDTLQFMRYIIALRKQNINVALCAQTKLHRLIQTSGLHASPLTPTQAERVTEGMWMPLLSIPGALGVCPQRPLITKPYIKTTEDLIRQWQAILSEEKRPLIGIHWQGNPSHEKTDSKGRSLPLEEFAPIAAATNGSLLSLQKGFGSEQLDVCSFKDQFVKCQDQINDIWDFSETAAMIANCDLVITSDSSVAHLAGGMGKTTWLLLKKIPEWRWGLSGETTFWYPCMRLFRQTEHGNWKDVMQRAATELTKQFDDQPATTQAKTSGPKQNVSPATNLSIHAPISLGELIDTISILQIQTMQPKEESRRLTRQALHVHQVILNDLDLNIDPQYIQRMKDINQELLLIESEIKAHGQNNNFGDKFVSMTRSYFQKNELRSAIKKEIDTIYGSNPAPRA